MKRKLSAIFVSLALGVLVAPSAYAVDFEYFKGQSCQELGKELDVLKKAEKEVKDKMAKAESKSNTQAVVTTLLVGWPFWGNVDHGDSNNQLAEIRADLKFVTKAQKVNKCT